MFALGGLGGTRVGRDGVAALRENRFKDAKTNFDRVLVMDSKNANANYLAGMARLGLKDNKGAVTMPPSTNRPPGLIGSSVPFQ